MRERVLGQLERRLRRWCGSGPAGESSRGTGRGATAATAAIATAAAAVGGRNGRAEHGFLRREQIDDWIQMFVALPGQRDSESRNGHHCKRYASTHKSSELCRNHTLKAVAFLSQHEGALPSLSALVLATAPQKALIEGLDHVPVAVCR